MHYLESKVDPQSQESLSEEPSSTNDTGGDGPYSEPADSVSVIDLKRYSFNPPARGRWARKLEFTFSCLGFAVGLGNVWRFPYICYKNGGGAFFVPYFIMLFSVGIPLYFLELTLGQFTSQGGVTCWQFAPLFQGVGVASVLVSAMVSIYYNMILAWILYYLFVSFTDELPWTNCAEPWKSDECDKSRFPAEDYFETQVLGKTGNSLDEFGGFRWQLMLCLLLAWVITALCISKGIKTAGKVAYVTSMLPYVCLIILLVNGLLQGEGGLEGIKLYITPNLSKLGDSQVWKDAATQIFFSLGLSQGCITTLASYNEFHTNNFGNILFVPIGNCLTSMFAGFVIFTYIGILADKLGLAVETVVKGGPGLAFVIYPTAVTYLPAPPFWSILFFLMMLSLGINSEYVLVESVITGIKDVFPSLRNHTTKVVLVVSLFFFTLGIPYCFEGGVDLLDLVDSFATGWNSIIVGFGLAFSLSYVYGIARFLDDVTFMLGDNHKYFCIPWRYWSYLWTAMCCFVTPAMLLFVLLFTWIKYQRPFDYLPAWSDGLGWAITSASIIGIFGTMVVNVARAEGTFTARLLAQVTPSAKWGPAVQENKNEWVARQSMSYGGPFSRILR